MTEQRTALDFEALRRASEQGDAEALIDLYAEDAEMHLVSKDNPPSSPFELRGRTQIAEFLRHVFDRNIESRIENEVLGEDRIAFNLACEYPDGTRVFAATTLEVRDGEISRQVSVETWDE